MKIVIPNPKSLTPSHPVNRLPIIVSAFVGGDGREPIQPRQASPGNVSMFDHLQSLKGQMESELEVVIQWP